MDEKETIKKERNNEKQCKTNEGGNEDKKGLKSFKEFQIEHSNGEYALNQPNYATEGPGKNSKDETPHGY